MSITRLPSGRFRCQVYDASTKTNRAVGDVLGTPGLTFASKREAKAARERAREILGHTHGTDVTIGQFRQRWTTDPLFARPKESTNLHNAERTRAFADKYGTVPLKHLDGPRGDQIVSEWLAGGRNKGTVMALRAMFNDARKAKAGRLIKTNPFAGLGLEQSKGNQEVQPPSEEQIETLIRLAKELTPPSFAAYLEFAIVEGPRPGELDALRPERIDWEAGEVHIVEQWNAKTRTFTAPKYGPYTIALVDRGRDVLMRMKAQEGHDQFVFTTTRGSHYTPSSRTHHWNRVRAAAGLGDVSLYMCTRHFWGWYALNILDLAPHVIAAQLGHKDGGELVMKLYGHPDKKLARQRIRNAHAQHGQVRPLRVERKDAG